MIRSVCDFLANSAAKFPDKIAFVENNKSINYQDFDKITDALASEILNLNLKKKAILIILPKGIDALISFFGVAKSGNFYSIIDEKMPKERIEKIIAKLEPALIITSRDLYIDFSLPTIFTDDFSSFSIDKKALQDLNIINTDLLYVLFTSGSTGEPKGVAISHKSVIDYTFWVKETFDIDKDEILANQAPFYFDNSVLDIYVTIATGASLHILSNSDFVFPSKIMQYLIRCNVSMIFWVPSVLVYFANTQVLDNINLNTLKKILFCGEIMPTKQFNIWKKALPNAVYANLYGPTEITDVCSYFIVDRNFNDNELLPIGKACKNTELLVFDEKMNLITKPNIKGELYVRGAGLSVGYYNDADKTKAAFIQNPLQKAYEEKIYKTGDIAAYNEYGELVCYGRVDAQIKLNGHRIELGEIEAALNAHKDIARAACIFKNNEIIAFYESLNEIKDLKVFLSTKLQNYMIPRRFIRQEKFVLNANGKIDRKILANII